MIKADGGRADKAHTRTIEQRGIDFRSRTHNEHIRVTNRQCIDLFRFHRTNIDIRPFVTNSVNNERNMGIDDNLHL